MKERINMTKLDIVRRIGDDVCEGCRVDEKGRVENDCGFEHAGECDRLNNAIVVLEMYVVNVTKRGIEK